MSEVGDPPAKPGLKVVPLRAFTGAASALRIIADEIDRGAYGTIEIAAITIRNADGVVEVFGIGPDAVVDEKVALLLWGGFLSASRTIAVLA